MNATTIKEWIGQSTTGQGFGLALATLSAAISGQTPWGVAIPILAGALVLIVWPQNIALSKAVSTLATDAETAWPLLEKAYRSGFQHGTTVGATPPPNTVAGLSVMGENITTPGTGTVQMRNLGPVTSIMLVAGLLGLTACTQPSASVATAGLQAVGVSPTTAAIVTTDAGAAGQLLCQRANGWVAVAGANVLNAAAKDVANVCKAVGGTPGMPASPTVATVVTVASDLIAALNAGKTLAAGS